MPKVKIGAKVTAGDNVAAEKKVFTNGHKSWTASEAKRLLEQQKRERDSLQNFELNRETIIRARNPILGDATPRETVNIKGEVLQRTGSLLFPVKEQRPPTPEITAPPTGRGILSGRRERWDPFDGNTSSNPLKRTDKGEERIGSLQNLQDNINGELEYIKLKLRDQQQNLLATKREIRF
jgi:hypothetical protein